MDSEARKVTEDDSHPDEETLIRMMADPRCKFPGCYGRGFVGEALLEGIVRCPRCFPQIRKGITDGV